jgi:hypothetical protein
MAIIDVSRPVVCWTWRGTLLASIELFALVWGVPLLVFLVLLPFGLIIAAIVRLAG